MNNISIVVGKDVDLLVILTAPVPVTQEMVFLKPGKKKMLKGNYIGTYSGLL